MTKILRIYSSFTVKKLNLIKKYGWILVGIPEKSDGFITDYEYFFIHEDIFDRIQ